MVVPFDTLAASDAMESVGVESRHARVIAAQPLAVSRASDAVTRPELEAALATLKTELLDRISECERGLVGYITEVQSGLKSHIAETERGLIGRIDRIAENQRELAERIAGSERRYSAQLWRLFGGIVAVAGLAVSAIKYLP